MLGHAWVRFPVAALDCISLPAIIYMKDLWCPSTVYEGNSKDLYALKAMSQLLSYLNPSILI